MLLTPESQNDPKKFSRTNFFKDFSAEKKIKKVTIIRFKCRFSTAGNYRQESKGQEIPLKFRTFVSEHN